jgi:hypothetical protein
MNKQSLSGKVKHIILLSLLLFSLAGYTQQYYTLDMPINIIKWNPLKILTNELAFSYERRLNNNAAEAEITCYYSTKSKSNNITSVAVDYSGFPLLYYKGASLNLFLKLYDPSNNVYIGLSTLFKYISFKNKWISEGVNYSDQYQLNCSQTRGVFGIALKCGWVWQNNHFIIEPYFAVGAKFINSNTTYNFYTIDNNVNYHYEGRPDCKLSYDNGLYRVLYVNLGFKIGFELPRKS